MKKKTLRSHKSHSFWHYFKRLLIAAFASFCIVFIGSHFLPSSHPFCANSISCIKDLSVHPEENAIAFFEGEKIIAPNISLLQDNSAYAVLGDSVAPGAKHIFVDLNTQTLYAYQGKTLVMKTLISSGKWHPTPGGDYTIWVKLRSTRMTGGEGEDFYDLPNVPYVMFFSNDEVSKAEGFSLHGAYWHDNFGHPMSHGCVNMRIVDARELYDWASPTTVGLTTYATPTDPGTEVTITGSAPGVTTN